MMIKKIIAVTYLVGIILFLSCENTNESSSKLEALENAKIVGESLDSLRNIILREMNGHSYSQGQEVYLVNFNVNGTVSGHTNLNGVDSVFAIGGHSGYYGTKKESIDFMLKDYSNTEFLILNGDGEILCQRQENSKTFCYPYPECTLLKIDQTFELNSSAVEVSYSKGGETVHDIVEIKLFYRYSYLKDGTELKDSTVISNYFIKNSEGLIFEW